MPRPVDPHDLARLARYLLVVYLFAVAYVLFSPRAPTIRGEIELLGHFALFVGLGVLVAYSVPMLSPVWRMRAILVSGFVVGLGTEVVQGFLETRAFELRDLAADFAGTIVAAVGVPMWPSEKA